MPESYEGCGYVRRSKVRRGHERETISIDKQRDYLAAKASDIGATRFTVFEDWGGHRSGRSTKNRPDWLRLKEYLKTPECKFLILFMIDRSARSVHEIAELVDLCQQRGKRLVTCWDGVDTDRSGWTANAIANINFQAVVAQFTSDNISDLMHQTVERFRDKMAIPWGMWGFGMQRAGKGQDAHYEPDPVHGQTTIRLLTWYASGLSYDAVSERLNDNQLRHIDRYKTPKRFTREAVRSIVGNILFYSGYVIQGRRFRSKDARIVLMGEGSYLDRYARAMQAIKSAAVAPLITNDLADAVIERRYKNQTAGRKSINYVFLLTPIAYFNGQKLRGDSRDFGFFYATRRAGIWIDASKVDSGLVENLSRVRFPPELREIIRQKVSARLGDKHRRETLERIKTLERQLDTLVDLLLSEQIRRESYNARYAEIERALRDARAELSKEDDVDRLMTTLTDMSNAIMELTPANQKRSIHKLFDRVDFDATGEIMRILLRDWARKAFGEIVFAMRTTPIMPPVSFDYKSGVVWFIDIAA